MNVYYGCNQDLLQLTFIQTYKRPVTIITIIIILILITVIIIIIFSGPGSVVKCPLDAYFRISPERVVSPGFCYILGKYAISDAASMYKNL